MKVVYLLIEDLSDDILGVFDSRELAVEAAKKQPSTCDYWIMEWEVNGEFQSISRGR